MIEKDTIKLLRECDAGVKMGMSASDDVMEHVKSERLRSRLLESRSENEAINSDIQSLLTEYHHNGKDECQKKHTREDECRYHELHA